MTMQSLALLPELKALPAAEDVSALNYDETVIRIRGMDRDHFAIEVSLAAEEAMEALFEARNVPDDLVNYLNEAYQKSFSTYAGQGRDVHEHFNEMMEKGPSSVTGFVSNIKGKVAELQVEHILKERHPGYDFKLAESATQPGWDLIGTSPDGPDIFVQVKAGSAEYASEAVDAIQANPNVAFAVNSEIYGRIAETHPELLERIVLDLGPAAELTQDVKDGLGKLAGNMGVDVPDSIGGALPFVGEVVLGIRLIWDMVKTERELTDVALTDRTRVHGIRTLALGSRFGINQVCMWAGGAAGTAAGTVIPGIGNIGGGLVGLFGGLGGGMALNRLLQPRIEEVATKLVGGDADDMFYLMNKVEIDDLGRSFAATQVV